MNLDRSLFRRPSVLIGWPKRLVKTGERYEPIGAMPALGGLNDSGKFAPDLNSAASALARHGAAIRATAMADRQAAVHAELRRVAQAREMGK